MAAWALHFILVCSCNFICGDSCLPSACTSPWAHWEGATENAPEMVPGLWSVFSVTLRLLTLFREVKQNLSVTFKLSALWASLDHSGGTWEFLSLSGSLVLLTEFGLWPGALASAASAFGFFPHQLSACSVFFCTKELFVCLLSASPQEISCDGKLWGSFLSEERLQGADNRDTGGHKPQQLRKHRHLELSAEGAWAAGKANHCLEWSGLIGQGNYSLENPQPLLTAETFTEAGYCNLGVLNAGPCGWIFIMGGPHGSVRSALVGLWRNPVVNCPTVSWVPGMALNQLRKKVIASWENSTFW